VRKEVLFILGLFVLIVVLCGGAFWLANASLMPKPQPTHLVLPDERIPH